MQYNTIGHKSQPKVRLTQIKTALLLLHLFNGLFSRTTWVTQYQKGKTSLDSNEARADGLWDAVAPAGPYANDR